MKPFWGVRKWLWFGDFSCLALGFSHPNLSWILRNLPWGLGRSYLVWGRLDWRGSQHWCGHSPHELDLASHLGDEACQKKTAEPSNRADDVANSKEDGAVLACGFMVFCWCGHRRHSKLLRVPMLVVTCPRAYCFESASDETSQDAWPVPQLCFSTRARVGTLDGQRCFLRGCGFFWATSRR